MSIGRWLAVTLALPPVFVLTVGGTTFPIVWSILGAAIFVGAVNLMSGRPRL